MLTLILVESALETIPKKIWSHSAVRRHSKKMKKPSKQLLLDRSLHHSAMKNLMDAHKRGRPDITHFTLLEALSSPLNKEGLLKIIIHTNQNYIITVNPRIRLPKNYNRFIGLIEQLFEHGKVPLNGDYLLKIEQKNIQKVFGEIESNYILGFSREGKRKTLEDAIFPLLKKQNPTVVVGGFPHGHYSEKIIQLIDEIVSIDIEMIETWTVISRIIYEYERLLSLPLKRISNS